MLYFWGILGIVAWIVIAFWPAYWAKQKGYSFLLFLILSWFISFILTLIIVALLRDKTETPQSRADEAAVDAALDKEARS
jgi:uncharacterized membrane protein